MHKTTFLGILDDSEHFHCFQLNFFSNFEKCPLFKNANYVFPKIKLSVLIILGDDGHV